MADYIPRRDDKFLEWAKNLYSYALVNFARWSVPSPQVHLQVPLDEFEAAFQAYLTPNHGKVDIFIKNEKRKTSESAFRTYVQAYLVKNPDVTDEDRAEMNITIQKTTRSPVPLPTTAPQLFIGTGTIRRISIRYKNASNKRGKPQGVHGIEVKWAVLDDAPEDLGELIQSVFDTHPPLTLDFEEYERGKHIYMCGRWEKGPFGDIREAVIP
ncbi:hypothetical protein FACS1894200_08910 [Spirochaetia bacterium]|nr:hypothetical protein FACS1894200_08910 [Spirochaetia bacterium]